MLSVDYMTIRTKLFDTFSIDSISFSYSLNYELLKEFEDVLNWEYISMNPWIDFNQQLLSEFEHRFNWEYLSEMQPFTIELLELYGHKVNWDYLSVNEHISWDIELIEAFQYDWNWFLLSTNNTIFWSYRLIALFESKINFSVLSQFGYCAHLIGRYTHKIDWFLFSVQISSNEEIYDDYFLYGDIDMEIINYFRKEKPTQYHRPRRRRRKRRLINP